MEKTLVLIKPEAIKRALVGKIIARFERAGLNLCQMKIMRPSREIVEKHYPNDSNWIRNVGKKR